MNEMLMIMPQQKMMSNVLNDEVSDTTGDATKSYSWLQKQKINYGLWITNYGLQNANN